VGENTLTVWWSHGIIFFPKNWKTKLRGL
jgi:hypothetical protein